MSDALMCFSVQSNAFRMLSVLVMVKTGVEIFLGFSYLPTNACSQKNFSPDRMHTFVISGEHHESPYSLVYNFQAEEEKAVDDVALLQANDLEVEAAETGRAVELLIFDDNFLDKEFRISVDDMIFKLIAHGRSVKCDFFNKFKTEKRSIGVDYEKSKFYDWVTQNYADAFASGQLKRTTSAGKHYYSGRVDKASSSSTALGKRKVSSAAGSARKK